uniref:Uncharacterized protein n=1 Tax=Sphaerodactylus townsendi TaxID=933632 RepID=A0ACB8ET21_9SAUR
MYAYLFLGILPVLLMVLGGAGRPCPTRCRCTRGILNCSRITNPPGFHQVPLPKRHPPPFTYLDFTGNAILSTGKEVWAAYPWAETLVLKNNSFGTLKNCSLEGLLSLTYLDLSYNKIQVIEMNAFEAVPFLQVIHLRGNRIEEIAEGTFRAWHGLRFLLKVDLSHNPLVVLQDPCFYHLPFLTFLDLGATGVTPRMLEDLLQNSLHLRRLTLPQKMFCCLCRMKKDIEVLGEAVKLRCPESCDLNATGCKKEERSNRMQEDITKVLGTRKWNGSSLLDILPQRAEPKNDAPERAEPSNDKLAHGSWAWIWTTEELLNLQDGSNRPAEDGRSEISELSPDITQPRGIRWKHWGTSASPPLGFSAHQNGCLLQGDLFETELNQTSASLVPNAAVRKLISHLTHILRTDCTAPARQRACSKVVCRSGLLVKFLSENVNENSSLWDSSFWPLEEAAKSTQGISRKLEGPSNVTASHETRGYRYGSRLLLALSVTSVIMIVTATICLMEIWSWCSIAKDRIFLGRRKKPLPDVQLSRTPSLVINGRPLWLKDLYHVQDETEQNYMMGKLHDEEHLEETGRGHWGDARPSFLEPAMKEFSLDLSFALTLELQYNDVNGCYACSNDRYNDRYTNRYTDRCTDASGCYACSNDRYNDRYIDRYNDRDNGHCCRYNSH